MHDYLWMLPSLYSVPVAIYAVFRYNKVDRIFLPFIWYLIISGINETSTIVTAYVFRNNAVSNNIYRLAEFILLFFAMRNFGAFEKRSKLFWSIILFVCLCWIFEYVFQNKIATYEGYIGVYAAVALCTTAVHLLNIQLTTLRGRFFTDPVFIFCIALIIFFSMGMLTEVFYVSISRQGIKSLPTQIFRIAQGVNFIYVSMLAYALSRMPRRVAFSLSI